MGEIPVRMNFANHSKLIPHCIESLFVSCASHSIQMYAGACRHRFGR